MSSRTETKRAREVQRAAGGSATYGACLNLLRTRGLEEALRQAAVWREAADAELRSLAKGKPAL